MTPVTTIALTTLAAFLFMSASWVMKTLSQGQMVWTMPLIFLLLGLAAWVEIEVLRATRMGHVMVMMLAIELLFTFAVACFFLGEQYNAREFGGVAIIVIGMVMLSVGKTPAAPQIVTQMPSPTHHGQVLPHAFKTSTPGKTFPSIHSRNAPPAVEI